MSRLLAGIAFASVSVAVAAVPARAPGAQAVRPATGEERRAYAFLEPDAQVRSLRETFPEPPGFARVAVEPGSFAAWLRGLPLRGPAPVRAHDGAVILEPGDPGLAAVAALDVGSRDLQQCADSIIRLHAEWLWASGRRDAIAYRFTSGDMASWTRWASGERPVVRGSSVTWTRRGGADDSRRSFRAYLDTVFTYAGTISLAQHATPVKRAGLRPGDFLVQAGSPGHAVLILDVAADAVGRRVALVGQGYMPAQDFHVLRGASGSAWLPLEGDGLATPFWDPFPWTGARRMGEGPAR